MIDINFDFMITQVPDKDTADRIGAALERVLEDEFDTHVSILWEDISWEDTGDHV